MFLSVLDYNIGALHGADSAAGSSEYGRLQPNTFIV